MTDKRDDTGPFDIIGDVHGCALELEQLLIALGYVVGWSHYEGERMALVSRPFNRRVVFLGDLVDRGPNSPDVLRIAMSMVNAGIAYCVEGNHERKLSKWLAGRNVTVQHGLQQTIDQLTLEGAGFQSTVSQFIASMHSYLWLDGGRLVAAHAGLSAELVGQDTPAAQRFAMYGDTTGALDEFGLPVRIDWAAQYQGDVALVYGHTAVSEAEWVNNTVCIDTGCVFGGKLTALRWPEKVMLQVPAQKIWFKPVRSVG